LSTLLLDHMLPLADRLVALALWVTLQYLLAFVSVRSWFVHV
jgi:hypothetical protein